MELKDLIGMHFLTAVDEGAATIPHRYRDGTEMVNYIAFTLDDVPYAVFEDPEDGYRSSMREIVVQVIMPKSIFPPVRVLARMMPDSDREKNDVLELIDVTNGKTILMVGTRNTDDYYPMFVGEWTPENMAVNAAVKEAGE